tara:strand:+ start:185 stop:403 length:219 start_codon:yes stop_codon:yes gene_type:complete
MVSTKDEKKVDGVSQMIQKKFSVTFVLKVQENNNIFSSLEEAHEDDVYDLVHNTFHDIDDVELDNLNVKERW